MQQTPTTQHAHMACEFVTQARLAGREQRVASREQTIQHVDAEAASQVAEAQGAAAAAYSHARRDLQHEFKAQQDALDRENQALQADRYTYPVSALARSALPQRAQQQLCLLQGVLPCKQRPVLLPNSGMSPVLVQSYRTVCHRVSRCSPQQF